MLNLPQKLPQALKDMLAGECRTVLEAKGTAFECPGLTSLNGSTLVFGLADEHTAAGRALVGALWFDRPLALWLCTPGKTCRGAVRAWRCHIVGPVFSAMLAEVRHGDPAGDIACAWELAVEGWEETEEIPPSAAGQAPERERELHLDNPMLRA